MLHARQWGARECNMQGGGEEKSVSCKAVGRDRLLQASGGKVEFYMQGM